MTEVPTTTTISPHLYDKRIKLNDSIQSVNTMIQMFQANAQAKLQTYHAEVRKTWEEIQRETGVDMQNINWEPGEPGTIKPVSMRIG